MCPREEERLRGTKRGERETGDEEERNFISMDFPDLNARHQPLLMAWKVFGVSGLRMGGQP